MRNVVTLWAVLALVAPAAALPPRERAIEQIPELMGRILESQEEIREQEIELGPRLERYDAQLEESRQAVEAATNDGEAAEALVDYVETYSMRLDEQEAGLAAIQSSLVRMRLDARELVRAAEAASQGEREAPVDRQAFFQDQFEGVASATAELAERLDRQEEASTAGAVLHASWASLASAEVSLGHVGPEGAVAFARKIEGLYARFQARSNQLRAERRSVARLLDVLIERQLARRLDSLFEETDQVGIGALLAGRGSEGWEEMGSLVRRTLGLPGAGASPLPRDTASLERLDFFARGGHRE